jgi:hypothetical protein
LIHETVFDRYDGQGTGNAVLDLMVMALINNLAHIHLEVCDFEKSRALSRRLERFALSIEENAGSAVAYASQVHRFLLNAAIIVWFLNKTAAAAAA